LDGEHAALLEACENSDVTCARIITTEHIQHFAEHMGAHIDQTMIVEGLAGGPDTPAGFHVIATMAFADQAAMDSALGAAGPVLADIPNFYSGQPQVLIGEVKG